MTESAAFGFCTQYHSTLPVLHFCTHSIPPVGPNLQRFSDLCNRFSDCPCLGKKERSIRLIISSSTHQFAFHSLSSGKKKNLVCITLWECSRVRSFPARVELKSTLKRFQFAEQLQAHRAKGKQVWGRIVFFCILVSFECPFDRFNNCTFHDAPNSSTPRLKGITSLESSLRCIIGRKVVAAHTSKKQFQIVKQARSVWFPVSSTLLGFNFFQQPNSSMLLTA